MGTGHPIRAQVTPSTFRRWRRRQVVAGRRYRTPVGLIDVVAVDVVEPSAIDEHDAVRAGRPARSTRSSADLRGWQDSLLYRIEFRYADEPDPRDERAADGAVSDEDVAEIRVRLGRLDRASADGPWTTGSSTSSPPTPGCGPGTWRELEGLETPGCSRPGSAGSRRSASR